MDESKTTTTGEPTTTPRTVAATDRKRGRGLIWTLLAMALAFLAGFGWQYYRAETIEERLAETEQELRSERLQVRMAQAAIAAQSGDFETARRQMSELFTTLQRDAPELSGPLQREAVGFLAMRDEVITGLSRSNPEYAGVLYDMLGQLRAAAGEGGFAETVPGRQGPGEIDTTAEEPAPVGADGPPGG